MDNTNNNNNAEMTVTQIREKLEKHVTYLSKNSEIFQAFASACFASKNPVITGCQSYKNGDPTGEFHTVWIKSAKRLSFSELCKVADPDGAGLLSSSEKKFLSRLHTAFDALRDCYPSFGESGSYRWTVGKKKVSWTSPMGSATHKAIAAASE